MRKVYAAYGSGKTGGHLFPAIAVSEEMKRYGFSSLFFIEGRKMETEVLKKYGLGYKKIHSFQFPSKSISSIIRFLISNSAGVIQSLLFLLRNRPVFTMLTGGYSAFPLGLASLILGIPIFIFEGNVILGKVNRFFSYFARAVFGPMRSERNNFIYTANPVRKEFEKQIPTSRPNNILVTGGSQGSLIILNNLIGMLKKYRDYFIKNNITFTVATGKEKMEMISDISSYPFVKAIEFIYDMKQAIDSSMFVVSRSGAMTVEENLSRGVFGIYIPFAKATADHQYYNAKRMKDEGLGIVMTETELNEDTLFGSIRSAFENNDIQIIRERSLELYRKRHSRSISGSILRRL